MVFSLGSRTFGVPPQVIEAPLRFGEDFRGQAGTGYSTVSGYKLSLTLEFPRLTKTEADALKRVCYAPANSTYAESIMVDRDRTFDGVTINTAYGRVLGRVKITSFEFRPIDGHYDAETDPDTNSCLESASLTVEEI